MSLLPQRGEYLLCGWMNLKRDAHRRNNKHGRLKAVRRKRFLLTTRERQQDQAWRQGKNCECFLQPRELANGDKTQNFKTFLNENSIEIRQCKCLLKQPRNWIMIYKEKKAGNKSVWEQLKGNGLKYKLRRRWTEWEEKRVKVMQGGPGASDDGRNKRQRTENDENGGGNGSVHGQSQSGNGSVHGQSQSGQEAAPSHDDQQSSLFIEALQRMQQADCDKYKEEYTEQLLKFDHSERHDFFDNLMKVVQWTSETLRMRDRAVVPCKSYGVFFEVSERLLAYFILFIIERDKNVQDRLSELGYRSFAPLDEGDGPMLICGYNIGDCETRPGRGISQGQRDLVKRLSAEYHARVPEPESIWIDSDSDGVTAGSGGAEAPAMDRLQQVESDGALARELQKEMDREEEDQRRRREEADALMAAQMQRDIEGGEPGQQGGSAAGAAFAGAVNPYATDPEKAAPVATLPYASAQASSRREKIERVVRDVLEGRYTAAQDPEGLLALVLPQKLVAKGAGAPRKTVKTRSPATSRGRGGAGSREGTGGLAEGRGGGGSVEGEETAKRREMLQELLCELHPLPAMPGREGGLLQVSVRAKKSEDDEDGVHLPVETSLVAQRPHVRTYTAEGGLLYVTRIRNLGDQSVTLTPEYYHISAATAPMGAGAAPEEQAREETITLQPGQESKEWGPLRLDVDDGERETGWKFEAEGEGEEEAILVLHVRLALG
jgi:hypothetical protein